MNGQVLLIIDVQVGLFQGPTFPYDAKGVLLRINDLSSKARGAGVPVIFVQHDGTVAERFAPGSPAWQLHPKLDRRANDFVVRKTACDSFYRSELANVLSQCRARKIVATGYATEFCYETTVRRAASEGFDVVVVSDAHTTKDRPVLKAEQIIAHHNWVLANLIQPEHPLRVQTAGEVTFRD